jgi:4-amino-4-deoxy-L-arabinose transferase-like glycosyltransferase
MEGGSVELAARVLAGHSLYAPPSLAFVGWTYTPLYYWVAAAVAKVTGIDFLPLRLVSLSGSLAAMAILASIVVRETRDRVAALLAAGLFAATFRISGAWFDIGRVDSLFLALTLAALAWGWRARTVRGGIGLGVLAFLAFFTKQTGLLAVAPALAYLAIARRRVGIPAVLTLVALVLASTALMDASSNGWYRYYVFSELAQQPWAKQLWLGFWRDDILSHQWPLLILIGGGGLALAGRAAPRAMLRSAPAYYATAALGLIGSAWVSRLHTGGYVNVLMPAYAAIALLAGLTYGALRCERQRRHIALLLGGLVLIQLGLLAYPVGAQIPSAADRAAGAQLIARLRALPGPVLVLRHPWYATIAGKGSFAQEEAIGDVLRAPGSRGARALRASLPGALDADHIQAVVLDGAYDAHFLGDELAREFRLQPKPISATRLYPLTDTRTAPTLLYLRVRGP